MRTFEEIVAKVRKIQELDILGVSADLLIYLPYEYAREFLKENVTKENWNKNVTTLIEQNIIADMKEYMPFALGKALNHRGISASRSIEHFQNWLFLLGDDELLNFSEQSENYENYGCPILKRICEKYSFDYPLDSQMQRMAEGKSCSENCEEGCGSS